MSPPKLQAATGESRNLIRNQLSDLIYNFSSGDSAKGVGRLLIFLIPDSPVMSRYELKVDSLETIYLKNTFVSRDNYKERPNIHHRAITILLDEGEHRLTLIPHRKHMPLQTKGKPISQDFRIRARKTTLFQYLEPQTAIQSGKLTQVKGPPGS